MFFFILVFQVIFLEVVNLALFSNIYVKPNGIG